MTPGDLFHAASALEDAGAPHDVLGRLYESCAQIALIEAGVTVDLMRLCGFDNPDALCGASGPDAAPPGDTRSVKRLRRQDAEAGGRGSQRCLP